MGKSTGSGVSALTTSRHFSRTESLSHNTGVRGPFVTSRPVSPGVTDTCYYRMLFETSKLCDNSKILNANNARNIFNVTKQMARMT